MMSFLQTGKALYVLAAICLAGVFSRLMAGSFYKRLIKESTNMALTKNKCLRNLKQNAEDTYRINQGMNNTRVYLERQMYSLRTAGMTARGLDNHAGGLRGESGGQAPAASHLFTGLYGKCDVAENEPRGQCGPCACRYSRGGAQGTGACTLHRKGTPFK